MDWNKIKAEYITTTISYRKLSEKYSIPFNTLQCRARKENWVMLRQQYQDDVVTKSVKEVEKRAVDYKNTLYELAYKIVKQIEEITEEQSVADLISRGLKPRDITGAIKDLEDILHIKSESDIKEQEARIAKLRKETEEEREDNTIRVVISNGAEQYSD